MLIAKKKEEREARKIRRAAERKEKRRKTKTITNEEGKIYGQFHVDSRSILSQLSVSVDYRLILSQNYSNNWSIFVDFD